MGSLGESHSCWRHIDVMSLYRRQVAFPRDHLHRFQVWACLTLCSTWAVGEFNLFVGCLHVRMAACVFWMVPAILSLQCLFLAFVVCFHSRSQCLSAQL